ncbi:MAG: hypothetical protein IJO21_04630 [Oscillospiraceae bacterium]|nr:hypothetical protein [Oscillospiraceae bacterium]
MKKVFKIWNYAVTAIMVVSAVLALLLAGTHLLGLRLVAAFPDDTRGGVLLCVKEVDHMLLQEGDAIVCLSEDGSIQSRRISEVTPDENDPMVVRFRTEQEDTVYYKNVLGTLVLAIPGLGSLYNTVRTVPGICFVVTTGLMLLAVIFLYEYLSGKRMKSVAAKGGKYLKRS